MSKIIQAVFSSGKFATTTDVFQWDKGDILQIEGLDLPESYEVHFSNSLSTPALVVSATGNTVETPAEVFENSGREVYAWIVVLESANVYHTIGQVRIPINPRGMPADLIPTPGYIPERSKSAIKEAVDSWLAEHRPEFNDGVPYAVKDALITLFEHVAYIDDQGETYLNNLRRAFALVKSLVSIEAVLDTGGAEITDSDTLGTLRQYLTVTATYDDGSTATVTDYTLSGTLEIGVSTIVVTYGTASDTVEVTVTGTKTLVSIGAVFDDSHTIYDTDTLEDLRQYLTVTAYYDDSSSREVINYTLSGTLTAGTSTVTVSYGGKTTTFSVEVSAGVPSAYQVYDYIQMVPKTGDYTSLPKAQWIEMKQYANLNALSCEFAVLRLSGASSSGPAVFGRRSASGALSSFGFYPKDTEIGYHLHGDEGTNPPAFSTDAVHIVKYTNTSASPSSLQIDDGTAASVVWVNNNTLNLAPALFGNPILDQASNCNKWFQLGYVKFFDLNNDLVGHYFPVVRKSDNVIGIFDIVEQVFHTTSTSSYSTIGNSSCIYEVGMWG